MSKPSDAYSWSAVKLKAWNQREKNPNTYYYRFNEPGQAQKSGPWSEEEKIVFLNRLEEMGGKAMHNWGIFSKTIVGRVGYQCAAFYRRKLVKDGEIIDEHYHFDEKGRLLKWNSTLEKKNNFGVRSNSDYGDGQSQFPVDNHNSLRTDKFNNENPMCMSQNLELPEQAMSDGYYVLYDHEKFRGRPKRSLSNLEYGHKNTSKQQKLVNNQSADQCHLMCLDNANKINYSNDYLPDSQSSTNYLIYHIILPSSTTGGIYLSTSECANDWNWIYFHQIKSIVNCTSDVPNYFEDLIYNIKYLRISLFDNKTVDELINLLEVSSFWIYQRVSKGDVILIHDNNDFTSSLVTFAYLIHFHSMTLQEAILLFKKVGVPSFVIEPNLISALRKIEKVMTNNKKLKSESIEQKQVYDKDQTLGDLEFKEHDYINEFESEFNSANSAMKIDFDDELNLWNSLGNFDTCPKTANTQYYDDLHYLNVEHQLTSFDTFDSCLNFHA